jgi:hypothetical protein
MEEQEIIQSYFLLNFVPFVHRNVNILNFMNSNKTHRYVSYVSESIICLTEISISRDSCRESEKPIKWVSYVLPTFVAKKRTFFFKTEIFSVSSPLFQFLNPVGNFHEIYVAMMPLQGTPVLHLPISEDQCQQRGDLRTYEARKSLDRAAVAFERDA